MNNNLNASEICRQYLDRLSITPELRQKLLAEAVHDVDVPVEEAIARLLHAIAQEEVAIEATANAVSESSGEDTANVAYASIQQRLQLAYSDLTDNIDIVGKERSGHAHIASTPPVNRCSMTPGPWPLRPFKDAVHLLKKRVIPSTAGFLRLGRRLHVDSPDSPDPRGHWHYTGMLRRVALLALVIAQTVAAAYFMKSVLPYHGGQPLEVAILILFTILTAWVSAGFWTAMTGFLVLRFGGDRYDISASSVGHVPIDAMARTAIIMPIRNENVSRVFAGLRATYESLGQAGELEHFDFFVLSDSNDPDARVAESNAWLDLCRSVGGFGRVFYRWRQHQIKRKSGNVADFCRRWGNDYRYMVVLDADSVMSGECLAQLVRLMEANPNAGIIQTAPKAAGRETFYARLQQFASSVYGPLFVAGLHFWQLGESHYWGHNAIIRVAPFVKHCALGRLPGTGSLSGDILSHDFVEAALMRRAGWAVWIAYDLDGSYEEMPPNLVDELQRDRRWCHGNLMNFRLFLAPGMHPAHRAVFMTGVIAYVSAPLWFLFLMLSTLLLATHTLVEPQYFSEPQQLFPIWPEWHPERAIALFGATATLLFLPKFLSVFHAWLEGARRFGGLLSLITSMLIEMLVSMLLAPVRMLFHTQFVLASLTGWSLQWKSPPREDAATPWNEAFKRHGWHTLLGLIWAGGVYWLNPSFLLWLLPVVGALILSIPISVYSSRVSLGRFMKKMRLFIIPEEQQLPKELLSVQRNLKLSPVESGFIDAVIDPSVNALACMMGVSRPRQDKVISDYRLQLAETALKKGPKALSDKQRMVLLNDPIVMSHLHYKVWASSDVHQSWFAKRNAVPAAIDNKKLGQASRIPVLAS